MCFAYEISCFDLSKNICIEHIIYLIFKNFKYIYFFFVFDLKYNKLYI
jgi:hypothetical protein